MQIYIFFRDGAFYAVELHSDEQARKNAECNPGTTKVENALTREVVWQIESRTAELLKGEK